MLSAQCSCSCAVCGVQCSHKGCRGLCAVGSAQSLQHRRAHHNPKSATRNKAAEARWTTKTGKGVYPSLPSPHPNPRTAPELSSQTACTGVKCTCHAETCACLMTLTQHLTRLNECERPNLAKTEQKKQEKASRISICNRNMHDGGGAHGGRDEGEGGGEERGRRDRIPGSDGLAREQFCSATATSHPRLLSTTARWQDFCVKFTIFNEPPHPPFLIAAYTCTAATV